jgi:hypothetical protein
MRPRTPKTKPRQSAIAGVNHFDAGYFFVVPSNEGQTAMQIDIPVSEAQKLARHAAAAGYESVEKYVTDFVLTLAERPNETELFAPMTDEEMAASLAMIDRGMEQIRAEEGLSVEAARRHSLEQLGRGKE